MRKLLKLVFILAAVVAVTFAHAPSGFAADLEQAKGAGLVGEQADGYLGLVKAGAPADVVRMVEEVNLKRRESYRAIAQKNNTNLAAVEAIAGKKLVERAPSGEFVRDGSGNWVKKP